MDPKKQIVEQFVLSNGQYESRFRGKEGTLTSEVLAGFVVEVAAIFDAKMMNEVLGRLLR